MKATTADVLASVIAELDRQRAIAAEAEKEPAAEAAEAKAREAQRAWQSDPMNGGSADDRKKSLELHTNMVRAVEAVRNVKTRVRDAQREIRRLEPLVNARTEAERSEKELVGVASEGAMTEKRVFALRSVVDAITEQRAQAEAKATAERTEAADRAIMARLEGKAAPAAKTSGGAAIELARLDDELAAALRQLTASTERLDALGQRAMALRQDLLRAIANIAELDYMQALADVRPIAEYRAAINSVAGTVHTDREITIDQTAVRRLAKELDAQYRGWQPSAQPTKPMPDSASDTQRTEPRARAAA